MSAPLFFARGLTRRFGRVRALAGVDCTVEAGDVLLLAGPNGAGKSTFLRTGAGLMRPTAGSVHVAGRDVRRDPAARGALGFLSHQTMLYDDLTARENLRFAADLHGLDAREPRVMDALDAAGLTPRADQRASVLSHGTRQRLAIARATLHAPRLLLLDEPFSGLDLTASELLRRRISDAVARGGAVICATHQPGDFWDLVTRVVVMAHGTIVADTARHASREAFAMHYAELVVA